MQELVLDRGHTKTKYRFNHTCHETWVNFIIDLFPFRMSIFPITGKTSFQTHISTVEELLVAALGRVHFANQVHTVTLWPFILCIIWVNDPFRHNANPATPESQQPRGLNNSSSAKLIQSQKAEVMRKTHKPTHAQTKEVKNAPCESSSWSVCSSYVH